MDIGLMEVIHESLVNGNRRQMVKQIQEYGVYDFWADYKEYLQSLYKDARTQMDYFADAGISYFRITSR